MRTSLPKILDRWLAKRGLSVGHDDRFGARGERLAVRFLRRQGLRILDAQVALPAGELDVIALDGDTIVFVEVKTRRSADIRDALEAVDARKQTQLTRLALAYLSRQGWHDRPSRFDVVGIAWPASGQPIIKHVVNAFEASGRGQMYS